MAEVRCCEQIVGSGTRRTDPEKVVAVKNMDRPETKKQLRQVSGFFTYFTYNFCNCAAISKTLPYLTGKHVPSKIPWEEVQQQAFDKLKIALCDAATKRLHTVNQ